MHKTPSLLSRPPATFFALSLIAAGCGDPEAEARPSATDAPKPEAEDTLDTLADDELPDLTAASVDPSRARAGHGFGAEGPPPATPRRGAIDLEEPTVDDALTAYGWQYQGALWYYTAYGYSSLSGILYPVRATHVLLTAPYGCAPYVSWGAVRRASSYTWLDLRFFDQDLVGGTYRAEYRIRDRSYDDDGYGYGYDDDGYGYYDDDDDGPGYDGVRINGIYLSVYGYAYNVGYGSCPIQVYTRRGY